MRQKDIRPAPARIEFKGMKFLITDRPSDHTIQAYIQVSGVAAPFTVQTRNYYCINASCPSTGAEEEQRGHRGARV